MKKVKHVIYPICVAILLFAIWHLWDIKKESIKTEKMYSQLAGQASESMDTSENTDGAAVSESAETVVNPWLAELQKQNEELVGWINIPGTVINYPVMQTTTDDDYYLTHDFEKEENAHGTPFMDVSCRIGQSDNLIIYGHHMQDGTMFQNLMKYKDPDFCKTNSQVEFDTLTENAVYQVTYVMLISVEQAKKFPYYQCTDLSNNEIYQGFLQQCSRYAIWQDEQLPDTGTPLLTLSTCEYSQQNGRLVVVAKKLNK